MNPYDQLGIGTDADDTTVREAYLEAVKQFPPDRFPERFAAISKAYEILKTTDTRLQYWLFSQNSWAASPMEAVRSHFKAKNHRTPPDMETMKNLLRRSAIR